MELNVLESRLATMVKSSIANMNVNALKILFGMEIGVKKLVVLEDKYGMDQNVLVLTIFILMELFVLSVLMDNIGMREIKSVDAKQAIDGMETFVRDLRFVPEEECTTQLFSSVYANKDIFGMAMFV